MRVTINGEARDLAGRPTVADLLGELRLDPRTVAVERNKRLVRRAVFGQTMLDDGDTLEIVTFVGGG